MNQFTREDITEIAKGIVHSLLDSKNVLAENVFNCNAELVRRMTEEQKLALLLDLMIEAKFIAWEDK